MRNKTPNLKILTNAIFKKGMLTYEETLLLLKDRMDSDLFEILLKEAKEHDYYKSHNQNNYELWIEGSKEGSFKLRGEVLLNTVIFRILEDLNPGKYSREDIAEKALTIEGLFDNIILDEFGVITQIHPVLSLEIEQYFDDGSSLIKSSYIELIFRMLSLLMLRYTLKTTGLDFTLKLFSYIFYYEFETEDDVIVFADEEINMYRLIPFFKYVSVEGSYSIQKYLEFIEEAKKNKDTPFEWIVQYVL